MGQCQKCAIPVFFESHPFPGEYWDSRFCDGCRCVILRREDITTRPTDRCPQFYKSLYQDCRLYCHMKGAGNSDTFRWPLGRVFFPDCINPGISCSAISISFLPNSDIEMSATRKGGDSLVLDFRVGSCMTQGQKPDIKFVGGHQ